MRLLSIATLLVASVAALPPPLGDLSEYVFVADYNGKVHTVKYTPASDASTRLQAVGNTTECGANPTWLLKGTQPDRLWCLDEADETGEGGLTRFKINEDKTLNKLDSYAVTGSPVQADFTGDATGIITAIYSNMNGTGTGGGVYWHQFTSNDTLEVATFFVFEAPPPGDQPDQSVAHGHGVAIDPKKPFAVIPDLGSDRLRLLTQRPDSLYGLYESDGSREPKIPRGTGPRHALFYQHPASHHEGNDTYLFVVNEIANTISTYLTFHTIDPSNYNQDGALNASVHLHDVSVFANSPYLNLPATLNATSAEIQISPDKKFLTASVRNVNLANCTSADGLATFAIMGDGSLMPVQYKELGDLKTPRSFDFHQSGEIVLVVGQTTNEIAIYGRNSTSGVVGEKVASLDFDTRSKEGVEKGIPHAIWAGREL